MSLADHWSDKRYLDEGWHDVTVCDYRVFVANNGRPGVEFTVENETGQTSKVSFWTKGDKALKRFAWFADACGLTKEEAKDYDETSEMSHRILLNRRVRVEVEKVDKYHEVVGWSKPEGPLPSNDDKPVNPAVDRSRQTAEADYADAQANNTAASNVPF